MLSLDGDDSITERMLEVECYRMNGVLYLNLFIYSLKFIYYLYNLIELLI